MFLYLGLLLVGGLLLYYGAEWMVGGASGLAGAFGVAPVVVGLTVVAYGTSAPELAVSATAQVQGSSALVLGNVIGSCVANLALILGVTALISPPNVDGDLIRREVPALLLSVLALFAVLYDGVIARWEAAALFAGAILFTIFALKRPGEAQEEEAESEETRGKPLLIGLTVVGLGVLVGGGELFVRGAKGIALEFGMSERLVGLTVVAIGTSLPELAASVMAALRGFSGLAVGNVVGSNIFNIFLVLGVVGLIGPVQADWSSVGNDLLYLLGLTVVGALFLRTQRKVTRLEGVVLLAGYTAFIVLATIGW